LNSEILNLLVISEKDLPQLSLLKKLPPNVNVTVEDDLQRLTEQAKSADIILIFKGDRQVMQKLLPAAERLRWIHSLWAGLDSLMFPELVQSKVILTNARGVFANSLAEFAIGAMLFFAKDFRRLLANQERECWEQFDSDELVGKTLTIFGYGEIGQKVASKAKALGLNVLACRTRPELSANDPFVQEVVSSDELEKILPRSDYLVLASALTTATKGRIGNAQLKLLKPECVLINIGRGALVDETALVEVLKKQEIRGAALDVFEVEPLPEKHELYSLRNVLLSPHSADHTRSWIQDTIIFFLDNFERFVGGKPLLNVVDKSKGY